MEPLASCFCSEALQAPAFEGYVRLAAVGNMEKSNQIDMLHGPLIKKLVVFAIPLAICSIIQQLFNSADAAVVGRYVGSDALAAVGATAPVVNLIVGLFVGLSVGANVLIAVQIGSGQEEKIPDSVHTVVVISLVSGIFLMIVGALLANPLLALISTPQDVLGEATLYLQIFFVSMPFSMMYNFGSAILRSKGDSKRPLYALAVGCLVNLLLDLLFVCVFGWGVAGAALATVIGFAVSCVMISLYLMHEEETFRLHWNKLRVDVPDLKYILKIGVPAGMQGMVFAISNVIIQAALNGFGADTIAGSTAGLNYEVYCYFIINAFSQAAVTFTGQNYAALSFDRCRKIYRECTILGLSIAFAMGLTFVGFGDFFTSIFTTNPAGCHSEDDARGTSRIPNGNVRDFRRLHEGHGMVYDPSGHNDCRNLRVQDHMDIHGVPAGWHFRDAGYGVPRELDYHWSRHACGIRLR